ncbi:MAG: SDR family NAD(P)-dependent oxidoreductase [Candidatus Omnitrophota bacterium]
MRGSTQKALVTGGAGFIGSHLCEELLGRNFRVTALDNLSTGRRENLSSLSRDQSFSFIKGDIRDEALMSKLVRSCDIVYHLAAMVGVKLILQKPIRSISTNVTGTEILLRLASQYKKKILITSSSEVYGKQGCVPLRENMDSVFGPTTVPRWSYAMSKALDEILALAYFRQKNLPVVIARFFNTVGPRQISRYGMVLPRFIEEALSGKPLTVYGNGSQVRSFTYVLDAVRAVADLSLCRKAEGEIFNVGSEEHVSIKQLAGMIKARTRSSSPLKFIPYARVFGPDFEDSPCRICDLKKIKKVIGYRPCYSLDDIIRMTIAHFRGSSYRPGKRTAR